MASFLYSIALALLGLISGAEPWTTGSPADLPGQFFAAQDNDILSALTWATLDLSHLPRDLDRHALATSFNALNSSSVSSRSPEPSSRRKRSLSFEFHHDLIADLEIRFKVPLFEVLEHTFFMFELPINFNFDLISTQPVQSRDSPGWKGGLPDALSQLEDVVSMLGVDGRACVMRTFCELAAGTPLLRPEGLAGEMVQLFVNHLAKSQFHEEANEIDGGANGYLRASVKGRKDGRCWEAYPECPLSLLNYLAR
ncbi:uncharacterized protein LOC122259779 [Penaeus japonicus]|uniref:uncharacterized protein LOC122259779 n=1 Tax=Penaeus japonicus TaxID=27405 RepID=UPI001C70FA20|nr:uncharacterized protein LOC122259779 [Penaeus japonicus]